MTCFVWFQGIRVRYLNVKSKKPIVDTQCWRGLKNEELVKLQVVGRKKYFDKFVTSGRPKKIF